MGMVVNDKLLFSIIVTINIPAYKRFVTVADGNNANVERAAIHHIIMRLLLDLFKRNPSPISLVLSKHQLIFRVEGVVGKCMRNMSA